MNRHILWVTLSFLSMTGTAFADLFYITPGDVLSQDFNTLAGTGTPTWTNNSTLSGWYSNLTTYTPNEGNTSSVGLYAFRSLALGADRSLGIISNGTSVAFGVAIQNNTGLTLDNVNISFDGEQWRQGNANSAVTKTLAVDYRVSSQLGTLNDASFIAVPGLNFNSPTNGSSSGVQLDGNLAANRTQLSQTLSGANWQNGDYLWLRWTSQTGLPFDVRHGLAIDNFTFSATAVPEPSTFLLLATAAVVFGFLRRRTQTASNGNRPP